MDLYFIILIAIALGMDAFAVSLAGGAYFGKASPRQKFRLAFHFGLFQFLMPVIGWFLGSEIVEYIEKYDHWIAFGILAFIGGKMIYDSLKNGEEIIDKDISKGLSLVLLSIATSIDALAVGFSIGIMKGSIFIPAVIIGVTAAAMSLLGIKLGEILSLKFGQKVSIAGGIILILIGVNILIEHMDHL